MKNIVGLFLLAFLGIFSQAEAQRYRNQSNLGKAEMVQFVAAKNGDILELNWQINTTRKIKSIELRKGNDTANSTDWETVKEFSDRQNLYVDYIPSLGRMRYKLVVIDEEGTRSEYDPSFVLSKGG